MQKTVLAYGETLWDLLPTGAVLGGAPFNFAYRVNSLGDRGVIVSRLGRDELGEKAWNQAVALGMDTRHIQWDERDPTGTVQVSLDDSGEPRFHIVPGVAYDHIELTDELLRLGAASDCLCFGTLIQRTATARRTLEELLRASRRGLNQASPVSGVRSSCRRDPSARTPRWASREWRCHLLDINLRKDCYSRETIVLSLREADVLKLNDEEARQLAEMFEMPTSDVVDLCARMMERWSLSHCVVTFGQRGAFAAARGGDVVYLPGYRVDVVDSCGSGDAFTAGFIHRLLRGASLAECCELGNVLGAIVASQKGATAPIGPADVEQFLAGDHQRIFEPSLRHLADA